MTKGYDTDILIIGGGINGVGIARDLAGRGLRVTLCEKDDLAGATSSASTKLIHGGLRYLEHYEFARTGRADGTRGIDGSRTAYHQPTTFYSSAQLRYSTDLANQAWAFYL